MFGTNEWNIKWVMGFLHKMLTLNILIISTQLLNKLLKNS